MIKLAICTAIHGRPEELTMFLENFKRYSKENSRYFKFVLCVAGNEDEKTSFNILHYSGINYKFFQSENRPLGQKFNNALKLAKWEDADYIMVTGSDDLIHPALFEKYLNCIFYNNPDFIGTEDCYFYSMITKEALYWDGYKDERKGQPVGSGRMFSKRLCEWLEYDFYRPEANKGLDKSMMAKLSNFEYKKTILRSKRHPIIALKGNANIWGFDVFRPLCGLANVDELLKEMI